MAERLPMIPGHAPLARLPALGVLSLLALPACGAAVGGQPTDGVPRAPAPPAAHAPLHAPIPSLELAAREHADWIEEALAALPLRRRIAQMVMPWMDGSYLAVDSDAYERLRGWVRDDGVGGLIVSIGAPMEVAAKLDLLQQLAEIPLLIAADLEHGAGQRLYGGTVQPWGFEVGRATQFPPAMGLGAAGDEELAYQLGRITAIEGRAAGIHMALAPVADVNNNPANPIINTRSYGEDPRRVAAFVAAHVRGLQEHGMLATAKHFPGHGDTGVDSHLELPVITVDRARAERVELVPFGAAVEAGVSAVMPAHIVFPALGGEELPATLSPELTTGLLRGQLGFGGLVVTDALDMGAIVRHFGPAAAPVLAIRAGADILLQPPDAASVIDAVEAAVRSGELEEARIDASVRRILAAKAALGLHRGARVDPRDLASVVGARAHWRVAEDAARRAVTLARDRGGLIPLRQEAKVLALVYSDQEPPEVVARAFEREIARALPGAERAYLAPGAHPGALEALARRARDADVVVLAAFVRYRSGRGDIAMTAPVAGLIEEIAGRTPLAVVSFGSPYLISQFPAVGTYLLAWDRSDLMQRAAARALLGEAAVGGRLPIAIPPDLPLGAGLDLPAGAGPPAPAAPEPPRPGAEDRPGREPAPPGRLGLDACALARADSIIASAIRGGVAPGAALVVGRRAGVAHAAGFGALDRAPGSPAATDSTVWDLASLTKPLATASAAMLLVDAGLLDLDAPLARYLPDWPSTGAKALITPRHLLLHSSGLPEFRPFWRARGGREAYLAAIADLDLEHAPGSRTLYSDLGYLLLGLVLEEAGGTTLDRMLAAGLFGPLGLRETGFSPLQTGWLDGAAVRARAAPTEVDRVFRHRHVHGEVHDENAYALGGVAGHAGLFSSARDLAALARLLLGGGELDGRRLISEETVRRFTSRPASAGRRALGWEMGGPAGPPHGRPFPASAYGHTGFTGTSIWIDPEADLFVILLTNRINPSREGQGIGALRLAVHQAVRAALQ